MLKLCFHCQRIQIIQNWITKLGWRGSLCAFLVQCDLKPHFYCYEIFDRFKYQMLLCCFIKKLPFSTRSLQSSSRPLPFTGCSCWSAVTSPRRCSSPRPLCRTSRLSSCSSCRPFSSSPPPLVKNTVHSACREEEMTIITERNGEIKKYQLSCLIATRPVGRFADMNCASILDAGGAETICLHMNEADRSGRVLFCSSEILWNLLESSSREEAVAQLSGMECVLQVWRVFGRLQGRKIRLLKCSHGHCVCQISEGSVFLCARLRPPAQELSAGDHHSDCRKTKLSAHRESASRSLHYHTYFYSRSQLTKVLSRLKTIKAVI